MPAQTMSGARSKFGRYDPVTNSVIYLGVVSQISWNVTYDFQVASILGRFSPASIQYTAVEAVGIQATGWRNFRHGPHREMGLPAVQDLLLHEPIVLVVTDRQSEALGVQDPRMAVIHSVLPISAAQGLTAKNLSEMNIGYVGLLCDDEDTKNFEHPTAMAFPPT